MIIMTVGTWIREIMYAHLQHLQMVDPSIRHSYHMLEDNNSQVRPSCQSLLAIKEKASFFQQAGEVGEPETVEGCGLYVPTAVRLMSHVMHYTL